MRIRGVRTFILLIGTCSAFGSVSAQRASQSLGHREHTKWGASDGAVLIGGGLMQQSGDGYLWLQASDGLLRFDGVRFRIIDSVTSPALRSASVGSFNPLFVSRDGALWASRPDGALLRYLDNRFSVVLGPDRDRAGVLRGTEDGSGRVWLMTRRGLFVLVDGHLERSGITPPELDTGTGVWVGAKGVVWHIAGRDCKRYVVPDLRPGEYSRPTRQLRDGTLWVNGSQLQTLRNDTWSTVRFQNRPINAMTVREDRDHAPLIATLGFGLLRLVGGQLQQYSARDGLSNDATRDLLVDVDGSIWMTTESGLDRLRTTAFTTVGRIDGVPFESPLTIAGDAAGGLWVGARGLGDVFHARGGVVDATNEPIRWTQQHFANAANGHAVAGSGRAGGAWVAATNGSGGISLRDVRVPASYLKRPVAIDGTVNYAVEDRSGSVWIALSRRGIRRVHSGRVDSILMPVHGVQPYAASIAMDSSGSVWIANNDAPELYEFRDGRLVATVDSAAGLTRIVNLIAASGGDTLWLVLAGGGLARMIGHRVHEIQLPDARDLLRVNSIAMLPGNDDFWIANTVGIGRLSTNDLNAYADGRASPPALRTYSRADGVEVPRITSTNNRRGAFRSRDGRVWFCTPGGIVVYDPELDVSSHVPPHAIIEDVEVSGRRVEHDSAVVIPPAPDRVEIHFTAPSLRVPERVRIEYRMDNVDTAWVQSNALRTASYSQMRPGRYRFRVRAWNEDGVPSVQEARLSVRVLPRWFESAWFRSLAALLLIVGGPLFVFSRTHARAADREQRLRVRFNATLAERARLSRELHDTLLQGFTGITLKLQAVRATMLSQPETAAAALSRVLDESDVALLDARQTIWDMRLNELDDRDLCDAIEASGRQMVGDAPIAFGVNACGVRRRLSPGIESVLYRIFRESVANALKHARASVIAVEITYEPELVRLSVRDDGVGLTNGAANDAERRGHFGIVGMRERASRAGGALSIVPVETGGTEIVLALSTQADDIAQL